MAKSLAFTAVHMVEAAKGTKREVEVGSIVRLKRDVIMVDRAPGIQVDDGDPGEDVPETVIKVILVVDGCDTCIVGFLPRHIALPPGSNTAWTICTSHQIIR